MPPPPTSISTPSSLALTSEKPTSARSSLRPEPARRLLRQTQPSGHRRPRHAGRLPPAAVEHAYRTAIERDEAFTPPEHITRCAPSGPTTCGSVPAWACRLRLAAPATLPRGRDALLGDAPAGPDRQGRPAAADSAGSLLGDAFNAVAAASYAAITGYGLGARGPVTATGPLRRGRHPDGRQAG